jgi:hypothetical protein
MMKNFLIILAVLLLASPLWAANRVSTALDKNNATEPMSLNIENDQALGGIALAIKFAEVGSDVMLTKVDFAGTRIENVELKEAIVDNEKKTLLIYAIPLQNQIEAGNAPIARLTFSGKGEVKFEPTTIAKQEGISLVSTDAKELSYDTDFSMVAGRPMPTSFAVSQNYPNPFNASTVIRYSLPENAKVKIEIFNILGQKVRTLVDEFQTAGYKTIQWNGTNAGNQTVASGVYFYKIDMGKRSEVKQMTMLK